MNKSQNKKQQIADEYKPFAMSLKHYTYTFFSFKNYFSKRVDLSLFLLKTHHPQIILVWFGL